MKGLDIFLHSLRQVLGNLPNAIKPAFPKWRVV
jgi:hypothetical protein